MCSLFHDRNSWKLRTVLAATYQWYIAAVSYTWSFSSFIGPALARLCICFSIYDKGLKLLENQIQKFWKTFFFCLALSFPGSKETDQWVVSEGQRKKRHTREILLSQKYYSITDLSNYFIHYSNHNINFKTVKSAYSPPANVTLTYQTHT